jgi:hypothetical protein
VNDKPLILLDVDGPLNPYEAKATQRPEGYLTHRLTPTGWRGKPLRVWLNPDHGKMLFDFATAHDAELAWATTWEHDANSMIAVNVGLPPLPVVEFTGQLTRSAGQPFRWKYAAVLEFAQGRPLVWLDDDFDHYPEARAWFEQERGDLFTVLHWVSPRVGITAADLDAVSDRLQFGPRPTEETG